MTSVARDFTDWLADVHRILVKSIEYHYPNFDQWSDWWQAGKTPQEAADLFLHMIASLPE